MKEYIKYFPTLNSANDYKIKDVPFVCGVEEVEQPIMTEEPAKKIQISGNTASLVDNTVTISGTWNTSLTNNYTRVIINGEVTLTGKTDCYSITFGTNGHLTINAGARLRIWQGGIVNNDCGSVEYLAINSEIQNETTIVGNLLLHPSVTTNNRPYVKINFRPYCGKPSDSYVWKKFSLPYITLTVPVKNPSIPTSAEYLDDVAQNWVDITAWNQLTAFKLSSITNSYTTLGGVLYTFTGQIYLNEAVIPFINAQWQYFGNAFLHDLKYSDIRALLPNNEVYVWANNSWVIPSSGSDFTLNAIASDGFCIYNLTQAQLALLTYEDLIWNPSLRDDNAEPTRSLQKGATFEVVDSKDAPQIGEPEGAGTPIEEPQQMR